MRARLLWIPGGVCAVLAAAALRPADGASDPGERNLVELGRRLFFDPTVSRGGKFSCASCHSPEHGFSDPRRASVDETGESKRHSQTLIDLQAGGGMHWDGEFDTLRELLVARLGTREEALAQAVALLDRHFQASLALGLAPDQQRYSERRTRLAPPYYGPPAPTTPGAPPPVLAPITLRLEEDGRYAAGLEAAFGDEKPTTERLVEAMHAFVLSIDSNDSAYDRFAAGDPDALSPAARRGLDLFTGKAGCATCHTAGGEGAAFTDGRFHNTGVAFRGKPDSFRPGVTGDGGRGEMTFVASDLGRFKTPTLRDVARTAPYMHDGGFPTLRAVVDYYREGGTPNPHLDAAIVPLELTDRECDDLVAFLESLTSGRRPGLGLHSPGKPARTRIWLVDAEGDPVKGLTVSVVPSGDRLLGALEAPGELVVESDRRGAIDFPFPPFTHVELKSDRHEIGYDRMIPDSADRLTLVVTPRSEVTVRVRVPDGMRAPKELRAVHAEQPSKTLASFVRVRAWGAQEALYRADHVEGRRAAHRARILFSVHDGNATRRYASGVWELDLSGGAADPIDLRADGAVGPDTPPPDLSRLIAASARGAR